MADDIQFQEPSYARSGGQGGNRSSFLASLVIKMGLAKDEKAAQPVLLIAAIIIVVIAIGIYWWANLPAPAGPPPPLQ